MKYRLEAKFMDGYKYLANKADVSIFDATRNCYWDILNKLPKLHGPVTKLALRQGRLRKPALSVDVPIGALPAYEIDRSQELTIDGPQPVQDLAFRIGYIKNGKRKLTEIKG